MTLYTPIYALPYLEEGQPARDTRAVLQESAETIEEALSLGGVAAPGATDLLAVSGRVSTLEAGLWATYTPTWTTTGTPPSVGSGALVGRYQKRGRTVHFSIDLILANNSSGGNGEWAFALPFTAAAREQTVACKGYLSGGATAYDSFGFGLIRPGTPTIVHPFLPFSRTDSAQTHVRNADNTGAAGTGRPLISGLYTFVNASTLVVSGTYESAA